MRILRSGVNGYSFIIFQLLLVFLNLPAFSQTLPAGFSITNVGSGWSTPVGTAFNKTGTQLFVWEKGGTVYVCNWNAGSQTYVKQTTPVLNISEEVGNWRDFGLLGFALDPDFSNNGLIYLMYVVDRHYLLYYGTPTYNPATNEYFAATIGRITRYHTVTNGSNELVADIGSRTILLGETKSTGIPILHESHGTGSLAFAADGTLLASTGDGASYTTTDNGSLSVTYYQQALNDGIIRANENVGAFRSQMLNSHNGKLLRIDPSNGNGISSNPFYDPANPRSAQSRVWAMGFRNPFRFCVRPNTGSSNPATGDIGEIYIGDVGYNTYEELNIVRAPASNCGWPIFEGLRNLAAYTNATTANKDEPNPLFGTGGCTQQYFNFQNLIKQATADNNHTVNNPCNAGVAIASPDDNRFFHRIPAIDWKHGADSARVGYFIGNTLNVAQIGTPQSGVTGTPFRGNCSVGGCWYTGDMFPPTYKNTYFQADYGGQWLKNMGIQFTDQVVRVDNFSPNIGVIVCVTENPLDGSLFFVNISTNQVRRIAYNSNKPPVVVMSSDVTYGPAPLAVNFTGNSSYDPEGNPITYSWDFGDGSPLETTANPSHTFTTGNSNPRKFVVKLTVRDNLSQASTDSLIISANNTPPIVNITSPVKNSLYTIGPDTTYSLTATVTDGEHAPQKLFYQWQTILRHNNHEHAEPIDTNRVTSAVITRVGCNGDSYYWIINLKVTDADGLSTTDSSKIFPNCSGASLPVVLESFTVMSKGFTNVLNWFTSSAINSSHFEVERSNDAFLFERIGSVPVRSSGNRMPYEWKDASHPAGYNFYRLKVVDLDGHYSYSQVIRIFNGKDPDRDLQAAPNPFRNSLILTGQFSRSEKVMIRIIDMNGKLLWQQSGSVQQGFNRITLYGLSKIPAGVYLVELIQSNIIRRAKLLKGDD